MIPLFLKIKFKHINSHTNVSNGLHIFFLFLKLIFTDTDIYLIDEPEVSLSLSFQKRIIGDIFDVVGDRKVIIATHAPYIYKDFKEYSEENKVVKIGR